MENYNPDSQLIELPGFMNLRDLGGMPLANGKTFQKNLFLRSGSPSDLKAEQLKTAKEYGIKNVIDLRSASELKRNGNPFQNDPDTNFYSVPLFLGDPDLKTDPTMEFLKTHHLGDFYVMVLEELGHEVVKVLRILLNCEGITLFHCAHGKDRTGVIAGLLYLIAGASEENIIYNYKVSYEYINWFLDPLIEKQIDELKHTLRSDEINMRILLKHIHDNYSGNISTYLEKNGMTEDEINRLYNKCVR